MEQQFTNSLTENKQDSMLSHLKPLLFSESEDENVGHPFSVLIKKFVYMICHTTVDQYKKGEWLKLSIEDYFLFSGAITVSILEKYSFYKTLIEPALNTTLQNAIFNSFDSYFYNHFILIFQEMVFFIFEFYFINLFFIY